jgi:tripartite ATP-independent transporter DctM subunit
MSWGIAFALLVALLAVFLASGMWTAFALISAGILTIYVHSGTDGLLALGNVAWNSNSGFTLTAVPLFVLMGQVLMSTGVAHDFFRSMSMWFGRSPGGLLPGTVLACGVFSAANGSSVAVAASVGSVAVPELKRQRYYMPFAGATLAAGGTLGILIPPSIAMILYSSLTNVSVADLFAAAFVPGIVLCLAFAVYALLRSVFNPTLAGERLPPVPMRTKIRGSVRLVPVIALIVFVLYSIYAGVATPTEAAALGALGALIVSIGRLSVTKLYEAARSTLETTAVVLAIMLGAQVISYATVEIGANRAFTDWIVAQDMSKWLLLAAICALYVLLGDFVEGVGMMLMTLPLFFPIALAAGFDPIWFGVVTAILIELGQITPPVVLNLFIIRSFDDDISHSSIVYSALPYVAIMIALIVVLAAFPQLALWLPDRMAAG